VLDRMAVVELLRGVCPIAERGVVREAALHRYRVIGGAAEAFDSQRVAAVLVLDDLRCPFEAADFADPRDRVRVGVEENQEAAVLVGLEAGRVDAEWWLGRWNRHSRASLRSLTGELRDLDHNELRRLEGSKSDDDIT